jgi:hypothetical protein
MRVMGAAPSIENTCVCVMGAVPHLVLKMPLNISWEIMYF